MSNILYMAGAMSFEEKSSWIMMVIGPVTLVAYLMTVLGRLDGAGAVGDVAYEAPLVTAIVVAIVASIVARVVAAIASPQDADRRDERDAVIDRRGYYFASFVLGIGALGAMSLALMRYEHFWIANTIYVSLVLTEVTAQLIKVVGYRRGY